MKNIPITKESAFNLIDRVMEVAEWKSNKQDHVNVQNSILFLKNRMEELEKQVENKVIKEVTE